MTGGPGALADDLPVRVAAIVEALRDPASGEGDSLGRCSADELLALLADVGEVIELLAAARDRVLLACDRCQGVSLRMLAGVLGVSSRETVRYRIAKAQGEMGEGSCR